MEDAFNLLNKYYDKIYVVTVEAAETRRKLFAQRFSGLDYSFFYGADKNKFSTEALIANGTFSETLTRKNHRFNKTMKPGEIACAWSHKMIYEDMIRNQYNRILIFEDDAVPSPLLQNHIASIISEIPGDCELLMWGWDKNSKPNFKTSLKLLWYHLQYAIGILKWNHTIIKNLYAKPFSNHLKKAGFHDYTYCYAINRSGAEKLISMQTPIQFIADNLLAHACTGEIINGYIVYPASILHDSMPDGTPRDSYIR